MNLAVDNPSSSTNVELHEQPASESTFDSSLKVEKRQQNLIKQDDGMQNDDDLKQPTPPTTKGAAAVTATTGAAATTRDIVLSSPALLYSYKINHVTGVSSFPYVSTYCEELLGVPANDVMADPAAMVNLVHPDDIDVFTNAVVISMTNLTVFDQTLRLKNAKSNNYLTLLDRSIPYRSQDVDPITGETEIVTIWKGFIIEKPNDCCSQCRKRNLDNTEKATSEADDDDDTDDLDGSILMDSPLIPFFSLSIKKSEEGSSIKIKRWNKVMEETTGYLAKDVKEKDATSIFRLVDNDDDSSSSQKEDGDCEDSNLSFADRLVKQSKVKCMVTGKTGNDIHFILSAQRSQPSQGDDTTASSSTAATISILYVVGQDITQLKQVTAERNEATRLAESERSITEWLSHEIRNPLSVVMEAAQTLEAQQQQQQQQQQHHNKRASNPPAAAATATGLHSSIFGGSYLQLIRHSITYVVDILTNMLDLNKLAEGKIILRPETCRLYDDILLPTQQIMMGLCGKVPVEIEATDIEIQVDQLRLKQVFANLISNSMKYTSHGFIKISIHQEEDQFIAIKVSDTGIGIKPSQYEHLFSRYEQLGSSVNGAGIGLCLCKNLLVAMGGDIFLNKDYDSRIPGFPGAQFVVRLPCEKRKRKPAFDALSAALTSSVNVQAMLKLPKEEEKVLRHADVTIPPNASLRGQFRVLVVDDELIGQKLLVRRFKRIFPDATIDSSPSGEKAVEMAKETRYDLITMDHYMKVGEMTGSETISKMRDLEIDSLIIGISGNAMRNEHMAAGADGFFQKPLPATDVVVRELFGKIPPPAGWKVLLVDDSEVNLQMMERKLQRVSIPHSVSANDNIAQRWEIIKCSLGKRAKTLLSENHYDLVVLDNNLESPDVSGTALEEAGRLTNESGVFVLNSGSTVDQLSDCFDVAWSKPLPSVEEMRDDLYKQMLSPRKKSVTPM